MGGNSQRRAMGPLAARVMKGFEALAEFKKESEKIEALINDNSAVVNNQGAVLSAIMAILVQKGVVTEQEMAEAVAQTKKAMLGDDKVESPAESGEKENEDGLAKG